MSRHADSGIPTTDKPCPKCGEKGHGVIVMFGLRTILCPQIPMGQMEAADPAAFPRQWLSSEDER